MQLLMSHSFAFTPHHIMLIKENSLKERGAIIYHHIWKLKKCIYIYIFFFFSPPHFSGGTMELSKNIPLKPHLLGIFFRFVFKTLLCHKFSGQVTLSLWASILLSSNHDLKALLIGSYKKKKVCSKCQACSGYSTVAGGIEKETYCSGPFGSQRLGYLWWPHL